jgi:hypothetical protein
LRNYLGGNSNVTQSARKYNAETGENAQINWFL